MTIWMYNFGQFLHISRGHTCALLSKMVNSIDFKVAPYHLNTWGNHRKNVDLFWNLLHFFSPPFLKRWYFNKLMLENSIVFKLFVFHLKIWKMNCYWKPFISSYPVAVATRCLQRKIMPFSSLHTHQTDFPKNGPTVFSYNFFKCICDPVPSGPGRRLVVGIHWPSPIIWQKKNLLNSVVKWISAVLTTTQCCYPRGGHIVNRLPGSHVWPPGGIQGRPGGRI